MIFENTDRKNGNTNTNRPRNFQNNTFLTGKLPPQVRDFEEAVLSALLSEQNAFLKVAEILKPEHFYVEAHQKIYLAIKSLFDQTKPIDYLTVIQQLRSVGDLEMIGGAYYITQITESSVGSSNIDYHARIILQKFIAREVIRVSTESVNLSYDDTTDILELVPTIQASLFNLVQSQSGKQITKISNTIELRRQQYRELPVNGLTGVGTGINALDLFTSGWQNTDLIILAARPGMGKTAFALNCVKQAAIKHKIPVAFFSLEMSAAQLTDRLISSEARVFQDKLIKRTLTEADHLKMDERLGPLNESEIYIDDTPSLTLTAFRAKAIQLRQKHNIGLIVLDYIQLMEMEGFTKETREQFIGRVTRGLKKIAKELGVPVIALSQLSRASESRPGNEKRPMLSDLRESGSIEQDADAVIFLYRPEYYKIYTIGGKSCVGLCEIIFAKHRAGVTGTVPVDFHGGYMSFKDWETEEERMLRINENANKNSPSYEQKIMTLNAPNQKEMDEEDLPW